MARNISSVGLVFLLLQWKRFLSAEFDSQRFSRKTSLTSAYKTLHVPFQRFRFQFPGEGESYLHIVKGPPQAGKETRSSGYVSVSEGKFISLRTNLFKTTAPSCRDILSRLSIGIDRGQMTKNIYPCDRPLLYHSTKSTAVILYTSFPTSPQHSVLINITAYDQSGQSNLNITYHTRFSGTVVPYGFDGLADYSVLSGASGILNPPAGHSVMFSFPHFHIRPHLGCFLDDLAFGKTRQPPIWTWKRCGALQLLPTVEAYDSSVQFAFVSRRETGYSGFKIRFSFHSPSEVPQKLLTNDSTTAVFNCSVHFYPKFSQHLQCNLETECVQGEDEASCPYSKGICEPGFLNAGSKCYKYIKTRKTMTWFDASSVCLEHGLTLASFPTFRQLTDFRENILQFAPTPFNVYTGLRTSDPSLPGMYRDAWQGSSGTTAYYVHFEERVFKPSYVSFALLSRDLSPGRCELLEYMQYIFCEAEKHLTLNKSSSLNLSLDFKSTFGLKESFRFSVCPEGHATHEFLSCDHVSQCRGEVGAKLCMTSFVSDLTERSLELHMYVCDSQTQTIHYTQVCDHTGQCFDSSDETFCIHQACPEKQCLNQQCVTVAQWCDGMVHCSDGSDETCPQYVTGSAEPFSSSTSGLHVVLFDGYGKYKYVPQGDECPDCPQTHFLCADHELCLPVYVRCNGVYDCLDHEDEDNCDDATCPGYYRCRGSAVCVHSDHVCDGVFQCPQQDDELLCQLTCPDDCRCQGLAFVCPRPFYAQNYSDLRYLDASRSGLMPHQLFHNHYLVRLSLSRCGLYAVPVLEYRNLKFLDLSYNMLSNMSMRVFSKLSNLNILTLSRNPILSFFATEPNILLENVNSLDLSYTKLTYFGSEMLSNCHSVKNLNLSHSTLNIIGSRGFQTVTQLESLDLRGNELKHYPVKMLQSLTSLRVMFSDVFKLCCQDVLPGHFSTQNCHTSPDEIASCKDLLRSHIYRLFLWITCCISLIGNSVSLFYRFYKQRGSFKQSSFNVFIAHLNISDFFMGLYLAMIGSADQVYRGTYLWHDVEWKTSSACKSAGFFSLLSCEMSAFIICFITLDRFLVMRFPFSQVRFGYTSTQMVCGLCWVVSVTLASLPLLPMTLHWEFYSQTGICIPLPVTRRSFKGHFYSFGIMIVFNFLIFILIAVGQLFIYMSVRDNSMTTDQKSAREATVARRLITIVTSDFLCWFPIGLLGLLASSGVSIPGEVSVAMAIFALPLNSALNPFLYTFNVLMEKRQKASEQRLFRMLQMKYKNNLDMASTMDN